MALFLHGSPGQPCLLSYLSLPQLLLSNLLYRWLLVIRCPGVQHSHQGKHSFSPRTFAKSFTILSAPAAPFLSLMLATRFFTSSLVNSLCNPSRILRRMFPWPREFLAQGSALLVRLIGTSNYTPFYRYALLL